MSSAEINYPIWNELNNYGEIKRHLAEYIFHVLSRLPSETEVKRLPTTCQVEVDKLQAMSAEFPTLSQLLRLVLPSTRPDETLLYMYNTSYVEFSSTNKFSRSALLADLPALMVQLDKCKTECTFTFPRCLRMKVHDSIYRQCQQAYEAWEEQAKSKLQVPFHVHGASQTGGGVKRKPCEDPPQDARLTQMLHELLHVY
jgi:hypothetical protein